MYTKGYLNTVKIMVHFKLVYASTSHGPNYRFPTSVAGLES